MTDNAAGYIDPKRSVLVPSPVAPRPGDMLTGSSALAVETEVLMVRVRELEAENARLISDNNTMKGGLFPLQSTRGLPSPTQIPWSVAEKAYSQYRARYGSGQNLERLAQRGGFSAGEMDDLHPAWRAEVDAIVKLVSRIRELEADLARVTAERDARVELPDMPENSCIGIFGCGEGQGYAADFHDARGVVTLNMKERKSTPTAALEELRRKMEERK